MTHRKQNRWKGWVLGSLGGIAGIWAMRAYWQQVNARLGYDPRQLSRLEHEPHPLDDISIYGKQYRAGESSTAALGRIAYQQVTGQEPTKETQNTLSYLVHWLISLGASGLYGAFQGCGPLLDVRGGIKLGFGLWLYGDEIIQPLLGLTGGPTTYPAELHAHSLGAHLAYGVASAAATQLLYRISP